MSRTLNLGEPERGSSSNGGGLLAPAWGRFGGGRERPTPGAGGACRDAQRESEQESSFQLCSEMTFREVTSKPATPRPPQCPRVVAGPLCWRTARALAEDGTVDTPHQRKQLDASGEAAHEIAPDRSGWAGPASRLGACGRTGPRCSGEIPLRRQEHASHRLDVQAKFVGGASHAHAISRHAGRFLPDSGLAESRPNLAEIGPILTRFGTKASIGQRCSSVDQLRANFRRLWAGLDLSGPPSVWNRTTVADLGRF